MSNLLEAIEAAKADKEVFWLDEYGDALYAIWNRDDFLWTYDRSPVLISEDKLGCWTIEEPKPKEFKIVIPEDKELAKRMAEECEKIINQKGRCQGISITCSCCPGNRSHHGGLACTKNGWGELGQELTSKKDPTILSNAQRWLEAYHAQLQPQYERIEREEDEDGRMIFNDRWLYTWINSGRLVGYFYAQDPNKAYIHYPVQFDTGMNGHAWATDKQLESGERIPGDLIAIKVRSET